MDNTHIVIVIIVLSIFSLAGLICGIIIHEEAPKYVKQRSAVKNSLVVIIVSIVFIVLFNAIYFSWHALHNHKVRLPNKSTKMK